MKHPFRSHYVTCQKTYLKSVKIGFWFLYASMSMQSDEGLGRVDIALPPTHTPAPRSRLLVCETRALKSVSEVISAISILCDLQAFAASDHVNCPEYTV